MTSAPHHTRVIVGMSGGVDSSVAALLLKQQGYHVEGLFMKNWEEDDTDDYCSASIDVADAQSVCDRLGIRLHTINFAAEYWDRVFSHFLDEYRAGRTPNPDILCNQEIKFKAFLDYALQQGADFIATGHYARRVDTESLCHLLKGLDHNKDQSYFLYTLGQHPLKHALFPIGNYDKPTIRRIAAEAGFKTAEKKDSTGICFIGKRKFSVFLNRYLPAQPGNIQTTEGKTLGTHQGLMYYTLGQRQGLGIGGCKDAEQEAWYVLEKDLTHNVLIVGQGHDHPRLFSHQLVCKKTHWVTGIPPMPSLRCAAKTRYRQEEQPCTVTPLDHDSYTVTFDTPQRAVTPGQSVVFYKDAYCLGGGIIDTVESNV